MRKYRFWYHFNKPKSRVYKHPILTVHYKGHCIHTRKIVCDVPTETHRRMKQPYMVVRGWTEDICILEDKYDAAVVGEGGITVDDDIKLWGRAPLWPYDVLRIGEK